jgi:hypothetical protein
MQCRISSFEFSVSSVLSVAIALCCLWTDPAPARERWPAASEATKKRVEEQKRHEDEVWQRIQPELAEWAKKGKPYIPWAAKPGDLPQAEIPAFPGAEGGGEYSFGGRGGKVYVVTSLEDSGPGTFREACEAAGPRMVVFNVAGIIHLKTRVRIAAPYITIAGQTAPGDGVCIAGGTVAIDTHDVVIRYMRFRRGEMDVGDRDDSLGGNPIGNIMIDHCSCSWGFDENVSMYRHMYQPPDGGKELKLPTCNITIQYTISSEALDTFNHAFGGTWGGTNDTFHHNLFACNTGRNCSIGMGGDFNYINNVLFNWRHRTVDGGDDTTRANVIGNYYKPGPKTPAGAPISYRIIKGETNRGKNVEKHYGQFYVTGNIVDGNERVTADNWAGGVQIADADGGSEDAEPTSQPAAVMPAAATLPPELARTMRADKPFPMAKLTIQPATEAYENVLANVGATLPRRDAVDARIIDEVRTGKVTYTQGQGIITDIKQVGGYPQYQGTPRKDSDNDGIPDAWEKKNGLNPNDPADASKDSGDGYTNIERYINSIDAAEAKYSADISKRADDIIALLNINDPAKSQKVHQIIVAQYRDLRAWHDQNDPILKDKQSSDASKQQVRETLKSLHDAYLAQLSAELSPQQVEAVKEKMTYGKVKVTYDAYCAFLPQLTDQQKEKILDLLKEAREQAMDAGSAEEKTAIFGKYKGKINNYLASEGLDLKKGEQEFRERQKAGRAVSTAPTE